MYNLFMLGGLLKRKTSFPFLYYLLATMLGELLVFALAWTAGAWIPLIFVSTAVILLSSRWVSPFIWLIFFVVGCLGQSLTLKTLDPGKVEYVGYISRGGTGNVEASMGRVLVEGKWMNLPVAVNIRLSDRKAAAFAGQIIWTAGTLIRQESFPLFKIESNIEACVERLEVFSYPGKYVTELLSRYKLNDTIAAAVFTGDRSHIDFETRERISDLGVAHLFAVSGLHIGLMYLLVHSALSFLMLGRKTKLILSIVLLFFYTLSTGPAISATRTFLMLLCYSLLKIIDYRQHPLNILGFSGIIIVMAQPSIVASISFQLSFFATAALLIFLPAIENKNLLSQTLLVGAIAQTAIIPLSLSTFGTLSLAGIPLTVVMVPVFVVPSYLGMIFILIADLVGLQIVGSFIAGSLRAMSSLLGEVTSVIGGVIPTIRFEPLTAYLLSLLSLFLFFTLLWHSGHKP